MNDLLNDYFDKTYITSILCDLSYNYYQFIYNILMFPTILSSSLLTILNSSSLDNEYLKIINITLNGFNTLILAINNNLKFNDRAKEFKDKKIKFNLLNHRIESLINKKKLDTNLIIDIDNIIIEFDNLYNDISFSFPHHIKNKIIKKYGGKKKLPNSLEISVDTPKIKTNERNFSIPSLETQAGELVNIQVN
jgi:hypothetical protein